MEVVYEDNHIIIVNKKSGEIVQGDKTGDRPLSDIVKDYIKAQEGQTEYEEKVRISRMVYNDTATKMNRMVRQWPSSFVASMLHFDLKDYLKADNEQKKEYPNLDEAFKK